MFCISSGYAINVRNKNSMPRSCAEARSSDASLKSGNYYIDPDGTNIGDGPIYVYCDMTLGNIY